MGNAPITVLGSVSLGWLYQEAGFVFDEAFYFDPQVRIERERQVHEYLARRFPDEPLYFLEAQLVQLAGRRRPLVQIGGLQPNLILGAALGAQFVFPGDKDPDITPTPLSGYRDLDRLRTIRWAERWPVSLFLEQIAQGRRQGGTQRTVIPPFFWDTTARATIHGPLTTAQKLFGEQFFLDFADAPGFARAALEWITDAYSELIELFAAAAGIEPRGLHVGECSACMIGPGHFAEFVAPTLERLGRRFGPLRLHSCGKSDHLLEVFAGINSLGTLNLGGQTDLAAIRRRFPALPVDLLPPPRLLISAPPAEADTWLRRVIAQNAGAPLRIEYHLDAGQPLENALQLHQTARELGFACDRQPIAT